MRFKALKEANFYDKTAWIIATWFCSGFAKKAPGTVGSLCSLPLAFVGCLYGTGALLMTSVILFLLGWWATNVILASQKNNDPGFVVIDETVGQTLTFVLVASLGFSWYTLICGFALFRFFDIVKIWPASYFDKSVHNAFGVMMDDVIAGIYAAIVLYGIMFFV